MGRSLAHLAEKPRIGASERENGSASETSACGTEPETVQAVIQPITGKIRPDLGCDLDPASDPIFELGWQLYGISRELR